MSFSHGVLFSLYVGSEVLMGAWRVGIWGRQCCSQWALVEQLLYVSWAVRTIYVVWSRLAPVVGVSLQLG